MPILLVSHWSELGRAAGRIAPERNGELDIVSYGRPAGAAPLPPGTRRLALPSIQGGKLHAARTAVGLIRHMRHRRYDVAVIAHPGLDRSWLRGPLLLFPHIVGARQVIAANSGGEHDVSRAYAIADSLRWALLLAASGFLARIAAAVIDRLPARAPRRPVPSTGAVAYLRTDLELRGIRLTAGGSMAHTAGIVSAMRRSGYAVSFWSTGEVAGVDGVDRRRLPVIAPANLPLEVSELVSGLRQALARTRGPRPTAFVYQRYSLNNLAGLVLAGRWRVPLVLEVNASEVRWRRAWSRLHMPRLARACEHALLRRADRIVVVSENVRRDVLAEGADPGRVRVVPNGVDVERFATAKPRNMPLPEDSFVIGFVGLFYPWHGVHVLAEAFTKLHRHRPQTRLVLLGDGEEAARIRAILDRATPGAFMMPGLVEREDVPGYVAAADVLVSPHVHVANFIGSPVKIFEYMASGRAIVATPVGQIAEVLRNRETALMVPPENPEALAAALAELEDDPGLRRRLGTAAQAEARAAHSWDARLAAIVRDGDSAPPSLESPRPRSQADAS